MEEKNRKLRNQFDADASKSSLGDSSGRTDLFRGIAIFVDGFTIPSSQVRSLMFRSHLVRQKVVMESGFPGICFQIAFGRVFIFHESVLFLILQSLVH